MRVRLEVVFRGPECRPPFYAEADRLQLTEAAIGRL